MVEDFVTVIYKARGKVPIDSFVDRTAETQEEIALDNGTKSYYTSLYDFVRNER